MMQAGAEGRFQEPISIDKYAAGERESDPIDLGVVTRVPVTFIIGTEDLSCTASMAEKIYDELSNADKNIHYE